MKRKQIIQAAILVGLCLNLSISCKYDEVLPFEPDPGVPVLFSEDIVPMFEANCNSAGCHNGTQTPDLRASVAYDNLTTGGYLNTETPEQSLLYLWMTDAMGPMPPLGANATNNATVLEWIKQGALNN